MARKATKVVVRVPDLTAIFAEALAKRKETHPHCVKMNTHYGLGLIVTKKGLYVLDRDGVGPAKPVTEVDINLYGEYKHPQGENSDMMPVLRFSMSALEAVALPSKEENLATFIRSFGHRLECSYEEWRDAMEPLI